MLSTPEWLPDPTGRHRGRYWDGGRWTDAVDDGAGAVSSDPLPSPPPPAIAMNGWYPDPLGRHERRYWDGVTWSTSVSDRGGVAADPEGLGLDTPPPRATIPAWYADPSGRFRLRWWTGTEWAFGVSQGRDAQMAAPDPSWPPPTGPRMPAPPAVGYKVGRKAGWRLAATSSLKAMGRDRCPRCGGRLHVIESARPGCALDYTPQTTMETYPPCPACGVAPPWATPVGLYPDPAGRHEYRWWDGTTWTDRVADAGVGGCEPLAPAA